MIDKVVRYGYMELYGGRARIVVIGQLSGGISDADMPDVSSVDEAKEVVKRLNGEA